MKKLNLIFMLALSLVLIQCGDDDDAGEPCTTNADCASNEIKACLSTGFCATSADELVDDTNKETENNADETNNDADKEMKPSLDLATCTAPKADKLKNACINPNADVFCGDIAERFTKTEDGIKDSKLMILWFPGTDKDVNLDDAKTACADKGGELPPAPHLISLFSETETDGTYLPAPFTDTKGGYYWTATAGSEGKQWGVRFKQGDLFEFGTDSAALASVMCWKKMDAASCAPATDEAAK